MSESRTDNSENYVTFTGKQGGGCASYVGLTGGQQVIDLEEPDCATPEIAIHEIMHAIGMQHEQSRYDRPPYITINWKNIFKNNYHNYGKTLTYDRTPYDYFSTLQYALGSEMTIPDKRLKFLTSAPKTIDHYDIQEVVKAYGCDADCGSTSCKYVGFARKTSKDETCKCRCPDGLKGTTCNQNSGNCGAIYNLKNGESQEITAPGYATGSYETGKNCYWLIHGEDANARIKVEVLELDIIADDTQDSRKCPH